MKSISTLFAIIGMTASAHAAVLASYTFTTDFSATTVAWGVTASDMTLNGQSEDPDGGTLNNDTYQFTPGGLDINRGGSNWGDSTVGKFAFNIAASGANPISVESLTMTIGTSPTNIAFSIGYGPGTAGTAPEFGNKATLNTTVSTNTSTLPAPFEIAAGSNHTFLVWVNSADANSTHEDINFTVNGIPEPSAALLGALGLLALLRRRR